MSTALITGGTGTTGSRVARQLRRENHDVRIASRSPARANEVRFDWADATTHAPAMEGADVMYLVAPSGVWDVLEGMRAGIETALAKGIRRFVLLSASSLAAGDPLMGKVHGYLRAHAPEWVVLRPSWFMQNFLGQHAATIREADTIFSATEDGRVPFIDAEDIAAVAARALGDPQLASGELILSGPAALSYADVASKLSDALGRPIKHCRLNSNELAARFAASGLDQDYAALLSKMDRAIAEDAEDRITDTVQQLTGRSPTTLEDFVHDHRDAWQRS